MTCGWRQPRRTVVCLQDCLFDVRPEEKTLISFSSTKTSDSPIGLRVWRFAPTKATSCSVLRILMTQYSLNPKHQLFSLLVLRLYTFKSHANHTHSGSIVSLSVCHLSWCACLLLIILILFGTVTVTTVWSYQSHQWETNEARLEDEWKELLLCHATGQSSYEIVKTKKKLFDFPSENLKFIKTDGKLLKTRSGLC